MSSVPSTSIPQPPPEPPLPLDERIHRAELRLIAREDRLKRRIDSLGRRLHEVTQPKRFIAPAIGGAFVLFALWMMLRGRVRPLARRAAAMAHAPRMHPHGAVSQMPWVGLLGFAWPLLPGAWRARVNPTTAAPWPDRNTGRCPRWSMSTWRAMQAPGTRSRTCRHRLKRRAQAHRACTTRCAAIASTC
jgi:hypothetical protein